MRHDIFSDDPEILIKKIRSMVADYRSISATHVTWYTHKNPYGCWICDALLDWETSINYLEDVVKHAEDMVRSIDKIRTEPLNYTKSLDKEIITKSESMENQENELH